VCTDDLFTFRKWWRHTRKRQPNSLLSVECWQPIVQQHIGMTINVEIASQEINGKITSYRILYFKMPSVCPSVSSTVSASINPLPSDRLRCCDRYIRCQRSLAVKPLAMSGSPSHRGSVRRVSRSQLVTRVPISNYSCSYNLCSYNGLPYSI